jgi:hypothetical protein
VNHRVVHRPKIRHRYRSEFEDLIKNIERFYSLGSRLSQAVERQACEYLIQEASMAFTKALMSLVGFLRFISFSQFFAREDEFITDLSSASVMARQVLEDTLTFLYLVEPNLTEEQQLFRKQVWQFHGYTEAIESAEFANPEDPDLPAKRETLKKARAVLEKNPLLASVEKNLRGRIQVGDKNQIVYDSEILQRRGIITRRYDLPRKVLSNFAHFSALSHELIIETSSNWQKSWHQFFLPSLSVAAFVSEGLQAFVEAFPQTGSLLTDREQKLIQNYRAWLRDKNAQPK